MKNNFSDLETAGSKAFQTIDKVYGADPELDAYLGLNEEDIQKLRGLYGDGEVDKYINEMEKRRVKNGR